MPSRQVTAEENKPSDDPQTDRSETSLQQTQGARRSMQLMTSESQSDHAKIKYRENYRRKTETIKE